VKDKRILTLFAIVFMTQIGAGALLPVLAPFVEARLGATPTQAMLIVAAFYAAQFLAAPTIGKVADRRGRKPVLLLCQLGTLFAYAGIIAAERLGAVVESGVLGGRIAAWGVTGGVAVLFAARVFDGITGGNVSVAQAYAGDISSESERASVLGFIGGATGLGYVVGPVFGGILSTISMVAPFYAAIGLTVLTLLLTQLVLAETTRPENSGEETDAATPAFSSSRVLLIVAAFFSILGFSALQNIFPLFGVRVLFADPGGALTPSLGVGAMLTFVGLVIAVSQIFVIRPLARTVPLPLLVIGGNLLLMTGATVVYFTSAPLLVLAAFVPFGLGYAVSLTGMQTMMSRGGGASQQGRLLGILQSAISLGYIVGPPVAGFAFVTVGLRSPFLVAAGAFAIAAMVGSALRSASAQPSWNSHDQPVVEFADVPPIPEQEEPHEML
jgi:DHA1 family tetracycline resistance protein-like MFS transporter